MRLWFAAAFGALEPASVMAQSPGRPVMNELFPSGDCSSSLPAGAKIAELAQMPPDLLLLPMFHLSHENDFGRLGPYAFKVRTERQRHHFAPTARPEAYTPVSNVADKIDAVGSGANAFARTFREAANAHDRAISIDTQRGIFHPTISVGAKKGSGIRFMSVLGIWAGKKTPSRLAYRGKLVYEPLEWTAAEHAQTTGVGLEDRTLVQSAELCRKQGLSLASDEVCRHLSLDEWPGRVSAASRLTRSAKALVFPDDEPAGRHAKKRMSSRRFHGPRQGYRATLQLWMTLSPTSPFQKLGSRSNAPRLQCLQTGPSCSTRRCVTPTCFHPTWVTIFSLRMLNISVQMGSLSRWVRGICSLPKRPWFCRQRSGGPGLAQPHGTAHASVLARSAPAMI